MVMHCYFSGSKGLRLWQGTTFARGRGLVGAGIHGHLPGAVGKLFPDGTVPAGDDDGLVILVFGVTLVVAPGETHVVGGAHLRALGGPGELIFLGVPLGLGGDIRTAEDGWTAVIECDGVVGEPGGEGFTAASGYRLGEAAFELHEEEDAGREGGLGEGARLGAGAGEGVEAGGLSGQGQGKEGKEHRCGEASIPYAG